MPKASLSAVTNNGCFDLSSGWAKEALAMFRPSASHSSPSRTINRRRIRYDLMSSQFLALIVEPSVIHAGAICQTPKQRQTLQTRTVTMTTDAKSDFWDRVGDVQAGMLGLTADAGKLVPMSPALRKERDGKIWFISAAGEDLVSDTAAGGTYPARFVIADIKSGLYANIEGKLSQVEDDVVLDELWNIMASAIFDGEKGGEDIRLLAFNPEMAGAWFSTTSGVKFLYEIAKAKVTGAKPDMGYQADLTF